jgi:hypothetical protein
LVTYYDTKFTVFGSVLNGYSVSSRKWKNEKYMKFFTTQKGRPRWYHISYGLNCNVILQLQFFFLIQFCLKQKSWYYIPRIFKYSEKVRVYVLNDLFSDKPHCFWEICRKMLVKIGVTVLKIFASDKIEAVKLKVIKNLLGQFQSLNDLNTIIFNSIMIFILNWKHLLVCIQTLKVYLLSAD